MSKINGETLSFGQERGPDVRLVVFGDEFYARYETPDGYAVVYDARQGLFCYALVVDGEFASTGVPTSQGAPGVPKHLQEADGVRRRKTRGRRDRTLPPPTFFESAPTEFTIGPDRGLLEGRRLSVGAVRGLTILVRFRDVDSTVTRQDVDDLLNGADYTRNGNVCSAREYFRTVSSGKLDYANDVVGPFTLSHDREFYVNNLLVKEALDLAVAAGTDMTRYDSRNEGVIDALNILYAGQTQYRGNIWPHNSFLSLQVGTVRTNLYLLTSMGRSADDLSIGTFCHENGHLLCRFPDMYDYGERDDDSRPSAGIGTYCLMGSGNHLGNGRNPSPVCAYLRDLAGWCDNQVLLDQPADLEAVHGDYRTVMKLPTNRRNEYFVIENRSRTGLDAALPASGLAVYHCDTLGSNELQEGSAGRHYQCALLQADGRSDLELDQNQGDGSDLFGAIPGVALSDATRPSTRRWDGADSGLRVSAVTAPGQVIKFKVGGGEAGGAGPAGGTNVRGQSTPALAIPDNDPAGVADTIAVDQPGTASRILVGVDVTHPYVGDLTIDLVSPAGRTAALHGRAGGGQHNLLATFDSVTLPSLAALAGQDVRGVWTLRVKDLDARDAGTLNRWTLDVGLRPADQVARGSAEPKATIPDDDATGVSSAIRLDPPGTVGRLKVSVDVTHSFVGDLRVELVSPAGRRVVLHGQAGGGQDDLVVTYDSAVPASPLAPLVGQGVTGEWVLRVTDLAGQDVGTLNAWSIEALARA
jgi:M6 family metalloprotease-like protein